ncbi:similar to Saccharomyces cerevisiae YGL183C MND1 Protein required for recombination and meiotic nuclear division [Maudiozyma saulgeensis]|uniref:Similar to Saccharomyces cerevisiae YGL183C MND1 Protein required for recombination and meiotic nuclear division n=1 Tax=Maudiozyma saulgeensis TaxID=1789683 RepID=A0A1X7QYR2_9SACH|nr:similar to Saccharomyces cerevisiae YGL183C MND1 Protein required for recombination and meiotic nuclear division [Kazachstania saulgeensis]
MAPQASDKKKQQLVEYLQTFTQENIFTQKEFEKKCPVKAPSQQMKEMLDGVMCEYPLLLDTCKCGIINVYYMYPQETQRQIIKQCLAVESKMIRSNAHIEDMKRELLNESEQRINFKGRDNLLERRTQLQKQKITLSKEICLLERHNLCWSAERIQSETQRVTAMRQELESLTDGIEILADYLCSRFNIDQYALRQELEIPLEFKQL